jgi:RNA polymerase sigma factor (sigma-70 family)
VARGQAKVTRRLQTLFSLGTAAALTDGELLERFATRHGAVAEAAFATLVERHGPVVLRVCRDVLGNQADADDAFQATFLVLLRRAESIRNRESVAGWLHGVALRVAGSARSATRRRRWHEQKALARMTHPYERSADDMDRVLHEEVGRLPEKYRAAVVLCYWEGLTHEQAADRLRWPVGTVRSRLSWARQRLRMRLTRRGLAPVLALAKLESSRSVLEVPEALLDGTVQGGLQLVAGHGTGPALASAGVLVGGVIRTMMRARWKMITGVLLFVGLTAAGGAGLAWQEPDAGRRSAMAGHRDDSQDARREIDQKIEILNDYLHALRPKLEQAEAQGQKSVESPRGQVSLEEYRQVRAKVFDTQLQLIEAEARLKSRAASVDARNPGVDPELLLQKRMKDGLRNDPEVATLLKDIDQIQQKVEKANYRAQSRSDPSLIHLQRQLETMKQELRDLVDRKKDELTAKLRDADRELRAEVDALKARKAMYEGLLREIKVAGTLPESSPAQATAERGDPAGLRAKEAFVRRWIAQLTTEAKSARQRKRR